MDDSPLLRIILVIYISLLSIIITAYYRAVVAWAVIDKLYSSDLHNQAVKMFNTKHISPLKIF